MMRNDPVLDRLRAADPSPSGSAEPEFILSDHELRSLIDERIGSVNTELKTHLPKQEPPKGPRRWTVAMLSAAAVLLIGLPIALFGLGGTTGDGESPPASEDLAPAEAPDVEVVDSFFDDWSAGSYDEAIDHLDATVLIAGQAWNETEWRNFMEYTTAVGMRIEASCAQTDDSVRCDVDRIDRLDGLTPANSRGTMTFSVVDGRITRFTLPSNQTSQDFLARFARDASRADYDEACSRIAGSLSGGEGYAFNAACGTYLATHIDAYIAAMADVEIVDAYFDAWNRGELEDARALHNAKLTVNGLPAGDDWSNFMDYVVAFEGRMDVTCEPDINGPVCTWIWDTAFVNAQEEENVGLTGGRFSISDGLISRFATPVYGFFEAPLYTFARSADPVGFESACASDGVSIHGSEGAVFNKACGTFFASHVDAFIGSLG